MLSNYTETIYSQFISTEVHAAFKLQLFSSQINRFLRSTLSFLSTCISNTTHSWSWVDKQQKIWMSLTIKFHVARSITMKRQNNLKCCEARNLGEVSSIQSKNTYTSSKGQSGISGGKGGEKDVYTISY